MPTHPFLARISRQCMEGNSLTPVNTERFRIEKYQYLMLLTLPCNMFHACSYKCWCQSETCLFGWNNSSELQRYVCIDQILFDCEAFIAKLDIEKFLHLKY